MQHTYILGRCSTSDAWHRPIRCGTAATTEAKLAVSLPSAAAHRLISTKKDKLVQLFVKLLRTEWFFYRSAQIELRFLFFFHFKILGGNVYRKEEHRRSWCNSFHCFDCLETEKKYCNCLRKCINESIYICTKSHSMRTYSWSSRELIIKAAHPRPMWWLRR